MAAATKTTSTAALLLLLALPVSSDAQTNAECGVEARGGVGFPVAEPARTRSGAVSHEELDGRGASLGVGFSCDVSPRFGIGADVEYEVPDDAGQLRVVGTGRMLLIGEQGGGALVLRGHAGVARSFDTGPSVAAPLPPDFDGTRFDWEATGPTVGGGLRARADLGDGMLGFVEGGIRTALLKVRERWEAGERVETESIFVTSFPLTAGLGIRF